MTAPIFIIVHYISTADADQLPCRMLVNIHKVESVTFRLAPNQDYRFVDFIYNDDRQSLVQTKGESARLEELLNTLTIKEE